MRTIILSMMLLSLSWTAGVAQPITNSGPLISLDFDNSGTTDFQYSVAASKIFDLPEDWLVSFDVVPWGNSRFLRASSSRLQFLQRELIDGTRGALTNYFPDPPLPPSESYGVLLLYYRAIKSDDWEYTTKVSAFERESELLIGLKLALTAGVHYGWVRLARTVVDSHTAFDLMDYAVHPIANEPIPAGEPPPLPPIETQVAAEGLTFSWDARWGPLVLESATNLVPPISWEAVVEAAGGPVAIPTEGEQRFYRLRTP